MILDETTLITLVNMLKLLDTITFLHIGYTNGTYMQYTSLTLVMKSATKPLHYAP